jgi:hypothetical protein
VGPGHICTPTAKSGPSQSARDEEPAGVVSWQQPLKQSFVYNMSRRVGMCALRAGVGVDVTGRGYRAIKAATNNSFERATDWLSDTWTLLRAPSHPSTTRTGKRTPPNAKSGHNNLHPFEMKGETTPSSAGAEFAPAPLHTQQREANPQTETKTNGKHP